MYPRRGLIIVALSLGLAWAVRGHFGHEHGAAWAGAIAAVAVVAVAGRRDWLARLPALAALAAIGWGAGGMMSYGRIVGFGRADDFGNVLYGLSMLGVVGGLYGFIGGGLFGLGLESSERSRPDWARLVTEMVAGAWIIWGLLIYQFEWLMTPPRSELWAACLGAALALAWYAGRNRFNGALAVAGYSALGAGFGFALGNFFQVLGSLSGVAFNWWNVMEFTLGLLGGLGMAYGVFSRSWPESAAPVRSANWIAVLFIALFLPATNVVQAFEAESLQRLAEQAGGVDPASFLSATLVGAWLLVALLGAAAIVFWFRVSGSASSGPLRAGAIALAGLGIAYVLLGHLRKGMLFVDAGPQPEQWLYWVVILAIAGLFLMPLRDSDAAVRLQAGREDMVGWLVRVAVAVGVVALLALVAAVIHEGIPGMQERF